MDKEKIQMIALIAIVCVALFLGVQFLFVGPDSGALTGQKAKLEQIQGEIKKSKGLVGNREKLKADIESCNQKSKDYHKAMISSAEFEFFRNTLRDMGSEYEVKVIQDRTVSCEDSKKIAFFGNPNFTEKVTNLRLTCKYHSFGGFLSRIENTSPYHQVTAFDLNKSAAASSEKDDMLDVNMEIVSLLTEVPA